VVPADREDLAELFGGETGDDVDKFARCRWEKSPQGPPVLLDCPSRIVASIRARIPAGDHWAFLLDPLDARHAPGLPAMSARRAARIRPGHAP
jgi:flavin reductase (DIM6/NTAB) family NADH-FMN oxidoreductase RutF